MVTPILSQHSKKGTSEVIFCDESKLPISVTWAKILGGTEGIISVHACNISYKSKTERITYKCPLQMAYAVLTKPRLILCSGAHIFCLQALHLASVLPEYFEQRR